MIGVLAVLLLVGANAFFVAAEFALVGSRTTRLEERAAAGDVRAALARRALRSLDRYISATQLGITLASLGLGWIGEPALARLIDGAFAWLPPALAAVTTHGVAVAVAFALITVLHIILGELVPKALALLYPETIGSWVAAPLIGFSWVMAGPIALLNGSANLLLRWAGVQAPHAAERLHSPEEIRMLVEQSRAGGTLERQPARLLEGVFEFTEKTAEDVMTPRTQVVAIPSGMTVAEAADLVAKARRSRYPVYGESLDDVVGVVHAKEILSALRASPQNTVGAIARAPFFTPWTREVEDVLADMKRLKVHLAVVLDEYGGMAGIVAMEDLLEEIVGQIYDEYDQIPSPAAPTKEGRMIDGSLAIEDFNKLFSLAIDDHDYSTIGGYVFGRLGRLPRPGDRISVGTHQLEVTEVAGRRVKWIQVLSERAKGGAG